MLTEPANEYPIKFQRMETPLNYSNFHAHPEFEIYYFYEGECTYLIGGRIYKLLPGDLIIMHGMTLHFPKVSPNYTYKRCIIHFDESYIQKLMSPFFTINVLKPFQKLLNYRIHLEGKDKDEVERILDLLMYLEGQSDPVSDQRFLLIFLDLLHVLYGIYQKPMEQFQVPPSSKEYHVQNILTFIENHYHQEDFQLEQLENYMHISKNYLSNIFREVTGMTIFQYLMQRRINQARVLFLTEKEASITEVSYRVGFKHPSHFSRVFKKILGCTADEYRRNMAKR